MKTSLKFLAFILGMILGTLCGYTFYHAWGIPGLVLGCMAALYVGLGIGQIHSMIDF